MFTSALYRSISLYSFKIEVDRFSFMWFWIEFKRLKMILTKYFCVTPSVINFSVDEYIP